MQSDRILTRDFVLVTFTSLFCILNYFFLLIIIVDFAETLGGSPFMGGLAAGVYVISGMASRIFFGKYIEMVGRKRMLLIGLASAVAVSFLYPFASSMALLIAVRLVHGVTYGISSTCSNDIVAKLVPPKRRGEAMGYYFLNATAAMAIGPLIGMVLADSDSFTLVFNLGTLMYISALLCALFIRVPEEDLTREQRSEAKGFGTRSVLQLSAVPLALTSMVFYLSYSGVLSFISSYTEGTPMEGPATFFFLSVAAGTLISRFYTGRLYDSRGPNVVLIPAMTLFIIGLAVYAVTSNPYAFLCSGFLIGYRISNVFAICQTIVIAAAPPHRYGVTTATFNSINDLGSGLGPSIMGILVIALGYSEMYLVCVLIAIGSLALYWFAHGRAVHAGAARNLYYKEGIGDGHGDLPRREDLRHRDHRFQGREPHAHHPPDEGARGR